jgi:uncharacterized protein (DUF2235 family)
VSLKDIATRHRSLKPPPSTEALKTRNSSRSPGEQWQCQSLQGVGPTGISTAIPVILTMDRL